MVNRLSQQSVVLLLALGLAGCASTQTRRSYEERSYTIGAEGRALVGEAVLTRESGVEASWEVWRGLDHGGWEQTPWRSEPGSVIEELLYAGTSAGTFKLAYREFRQRQSLPDPNAHNFHLWNEAETWLAFPSLYMTVEYDLEKDGEIAFRNYRLKVHEADNTSIRYTVVSDVVTLADPPGSE